MDRSARTLVAIVLLTIAGFLGAELLIRRAPVGEWALPALLALVGLVVLWLGIRPEREAAPLPVVVPELTLAPALAAAAPAPAALPAAPVAAPVIAPTPLPPTPPVLEPDAPVASSQGPDNLLVLDGIGPKIAEALNAAGVTAFAQVAEMTPEALRGIVQSANVRLVGDSIETWPAQAKLAAAGDWAGLRALIAEQRK